MSDGGNGHGDEAQMRIDLRAAMCLERIERDKQGWCLLPKGHAGPHHGVVTEGALVSYTKGKAGHG